MCLSHCWLFYMECPWQTIRGKILVWLSYLFSFFGKADTFRVVCYILRCIMMNYRKIDVCCCVHQLICDADMKITNCVAKWPGSVHDARILRESGIFDAFESDRPPLNGFILGDSGYMLRNWLMTPVANIRSPRDEAFNAAHCGTRCTIEQCIGVLKRRWHCLHTELRVTPQRACEIICACVVLHNHALHYNHVLDDVDDMDEMGNNNAPPARTLSEQAWLAAGKAARDQLINNIF